MHGVSVKMVEKGARKCVNRSVGEVKGEVEGVGTVWGECEGCGRRWGYEEVWEKV